MNKSGENNVIIIGKGSIGKAVANKVRENPRWNLAAIVSGREVQLCNGNHAGPNLVKFDSTDPRTLANALNLQDIKRAFIAIPSAGGGKIALKYIAALLENGVKVVTCEKGAVANFYPQLVKLGLENIGVSATVGGGTRMLSFLKDRRLIDLGPRPCRVDAILNGTFNFIGDRGTNSFPQAVAEAVALHITEPGATKPKDVIEAEFGDVVMKASAAYNVAFARDGNYLDPSMFEIEKLSSAGLKILSRRPHRYVVSFNNTKNGDSISDLVGAMHASIDGWEIIGGFYTEADSPIPEDQLPKRQDNAVVVAQGLDGEDGIYRLSGPGAGPKATASAMITDAFHLLS